MNIKDAARLTGLPAKTIRYYEDIALLRPLRGSNGYRAFRETDVHKLAFLGRARALGFTIEDCRTLLSLYEDKTRASADVKRIAEVHLGQIAEKIEALRSVQKTLKTLVDACCGDHRPDCPILADIAAPPPTRF